MKTKRTVIAVIAAALLVSAMLIVGCMSQIDEITVKDDGAINYPIPAGKGVVRFKVADKNVRTILPDFTQYATSDSNVGLMFFDIRFTRTTADTDVNKVIYWPGNGDYEGEGGSGSPTTKETFENVSKPLTVTAGTYTILITAYDKATGPGIIPIAGTTVTGLNVTSGTTETRTIELLPLIDPDYEGKFAYKIKLPESNLPSSAAYSTRTVEIFDYSDWSTDPDSATDVSSGITLTQDDYTEDEESLPGGYYIVKVTVGNPKYITRQYTEALHIYPGYTSVLYELDVPALIQNVYDITFDPVHQLTNTPSPDVVAQQITYPGKVIEPGTPEADNWTFDSWRVGSKEGVAWDFSVRPSADLHLVALWNQDAGFTITLKEGTEQMGAPTPDQPSIVRNNFDGLGTFTVTIATPLDGVSSWDVGSIKWSVSGLTGAQVASAVINDELVITNSDTGIFAPLLIDSYLRVTVTASITEGSPPVVKPYSLTIDIPIED